MILAKSKETQTRNMQKWTLSLTQRLLFALNGSILLCEDKSKLIHCLDKPHNEINKSKQLYLSKNHIKGSDVPHTSIDKMRKIAIVDCMVLVQQMTKSQEQLVLLKIFKTAIQWQVVYINRRFWWSYFCLWYLQSWFIETETERKKSARQKQYQIVDDTNIKPIQMRRFLSRDKTKAGLLNTLLKKSSRRTQTHQR